MPFKLDSVPFWLKENIPLKERHSIATKAKLKNDGQVIVFPFTDTF